MVVAPRMSPPKRETIEMLRKMTNMSLTKVRSRKPSFLRSKRSTDFQEIVTGHFKTSHSGDSIHIRFLDSDKEPPSLRMPKRLYSKFGAVWAASTASSSSLEK